MEQEVRYARNPEFIFRTILGDGLLVPMRRQIEEMDHIYTLNAAGTLIWQRLETPATEAELQAAVLEEYAAEPETVAADVQRFLDGMAALGAIRRV